MRTQNARRKKLITTVIACALVLVLLAGCFLIALAVSVSKAKADETYGMPIAERNLARAKNLADAYLANYYNESSHKLTFYQSGKIASCWEYSGMISVVYKMSLLDAAYLEYMDGILEGLTYYRHYKNGSFNGYAVNRARRPNEANDGVAYDDNMWLGRDFLAFYALTNDEKYLSLAKEIAVFLIREAYVELNPAMFLETLGREPAGDIGGFYWDYNHGALHACSTGPAVQFFAALYNTTKEAEYLTYAENTFRYVEYLEDEETGVFHDLLRFKKDAHNNITGIAEFDTAKYSYNSGSPITGAIELYKATGNNAYLSAARRWAKAADAYFPKAVAGQDVKAFTDNCWFRAVLLNGYMALRAYEAEADSYIRTMEKSISYAYETHRQRGAFGFNKNLIPADWIDGAQKGDNLRHWSLNMGGNAEIYASLAEYRKLGSSK